MNVECLGERIAKTLDLYDQEKTGIAVGSVAMRWAGLDVEVGDVDQMRSPEEVIKLREQLLEDRVGNTSYISGTADYDGVAGEHLSLEPQEHMLGKILPYQAFSIVQDERHRMEYETAKALAVLHEESGRMMLPLFEILLWKATVGREKDIKLVYAILGSSEVRAMLTVDELQTLRKALLVHSIGSSPK